MPKNRELADYIMDQLSDLGGYTQYPHDGRVCVLLQGADIRWGLRGRLHGEDHRGQQEVHAGQRAGVPIRRRKAHAAGNHLGQQDSAAKYGGSDVSGAAGKKGEEEKGIEHGHGRTASVFS